MEFVGKEVRVRQFRVAGSISTLSGWFEVTADRIVLHDVFSLQAINVDGAGDGGRDWLVFSRDGNVVLAAIQDTIQSARWEEKALADAKTAETVHHPNRYYFLTKRHHQQTTVTRLEDEIVRQTGMATTVLEARRIAELIIERSLEGKVLEILGEGKSARPPRAPEIAFWVYTNLSADRLNHRNQIYDDTLLCVLYEQGSVARSALVDRAVSFLGCPVTNRPMLDRRVDALISSRKIARNADGLFALSSETRKRLNETEGLYLSDWNSLTGAMTSVLEDLGAHWDGDQSERGAVLLARWFVLEQVNCLRNAKADVLPGVWLDETADPQQQLRDLLQLCGVKARQLDDAIGKLIAIARDRPAVLKLTRTAVFAALEGSDPLLSSKALGAARWEDVSVLLDACVAMPALCALLTSRVESYLFAISQRAVEMLDGFGVKLRILPGYLEECASHLLRATRYEPVESEHDLAAALKHSENAFVAYYYALKAEEKKVPSSLHGFLKVFSERVVEVARNTDSATLAAQKIMPDLQRAFSDYGILLEQPERIPALRYGEITRGHDVILAGEGREKVPRLRAHDIAAMAHLEGRNLNRGEIWMLLTWDGVVIK